MKKRNKKRKRMKKRIGRRGKVLLVISKASNNVADVVTPAYLVNTVITSCRNQHQASGDLRLVFFFFLIIINYLIRGHG